MTIGNKFLIRLGAQHVRDVCHAQQLLVEAEIALRSVEATLRSIPGLAIEADKMLRSADGLKHEHGLVGRRLNEILDRGRRAGAGCCKACGCALAADQTCELCPGATP